MSKNKFPQFLRTILFWVGRVHSLSEMGEQDKDNPLDRSRELGWFHMSNLKADKHYNKTVC